MESAYSSCFAFGKHPYYVWRIRAARKANSPAKSVSVIISRMWDSVTHVLSRVLTMAWFAGAVLMILTIPACAVKIFSALWEDSDEEDQAVYEGVRKK